MVWSCTRCTFHNADHFSKCDMCGANPPPLWPPQGLSPTQRPLPSSAATPSSSSSPSLAPTAYVNSEEDAAAVNIGQSRTAGGVGGVSVDTFFRSQSFMNVGVKSSPTSSLRSTPPPPPPPPLQLQHSPFTEPRATSSSSSSTTASFSSPPLSSDDKKSNTKKKDSAFGRATPPPSLASHILPPTSSSSSSPHAYTPPPLITSNVPLSELPSVMRRISEDCQRRGEEGGGHRRRRFVDEAFRSQHTNQKKETATASAFGATVTPMVASALQTAESGGGSSSLTWKPYTELWCTAGRCRYSDQIVSPTEGVRASSLKQGRLGDCWFLSALAALAYSHPSAITALLLGEDTFTEEGAFAVMLWRDGQWGAYIVDDAFPCTPATATTNPLPPSLPAPSPSHPQRRPDLLYAHSTDGTLWAAIIEKAYAKMHGGGYPAIVSGYAIHALQALTGDPCESIELPNYSKLGLLGGGGGGGGERGGVGDANINTNNNPPVTAATANKNAATADEAWARAQSYIDAGCILCASCGDEVATTPTTIMPTTTEGGGGQQQQQQQLHHQGNATMSKANALGLTARHCYSVLAARSDPLTGARYILLRNPHGSGDRWKGRLSRGAPMWDDDDDDGGAAAGGSRGDYKKMKTNGSKKGRLAALLDKQTTTDAGDGQLWMLYEEEFLAYFCTVIVCRTMRYGVVKSIPNLFMMPSGTSCPIRLRIDQTTSVYIRAVQQSERSHRGDPSYRYYDVGILVVRCDDPKQTWHALPDCNDIVMLSALLLVGEYAVFFYSISQLQMATVRPFVANFHIEGSAASINDEADDDDNHHHQHRHHHSHHSSDKNLTTRAPLRLAPLFPAALAYSLRFSKDLAVKSSEMLENINVYFIRGSRPTVYAVVVENNNTTANPQSVSVSSPSSSSSSPLATKSKSNDGNKITTTGSSSSSCIEGSASVKGLVKAACFTLRLQKKACHGLVYSRGKYNPNFNTTTTTTTTNAAATAAAVAAVSKMNTDDHGGDEDNDDDAAVVEDVVLPGQRMVLQLAVSMPRLRNETYCASFAYTVAVRTMMVPSPNSPSPNAFSPSSFLSSLLRNSPSLSLSPSTKTITTLTDIHAKALLIPSSSSSLALGRGEKRVVPGRGQRSMMRRKKGVGTALLGSSTRAKRKRRRRSWEKSQNLCRSSIKDASPA